MTSLNRKDLQQMFFCKEYKMKLLTMEHDSAGTKSVDGEMGVLHIAVAMPHTSERTSSIRARAPRAFAAEAKQKSTKMEGDVGPP
jgi:hypothetical protein